MKSLILDALKPNNNTAQIFSNIVNKIPNFSNPSNFVCDCMKEFDSFQMNSQKSEASKKPTHGTYFEYTIGECLIQKGLIPVYYQLTFDNRINVYDWLLYNKTSPVMISCKTRLTTWKQAAWEALELKRIFPNGECYLITNTRESKISKVNEDLKKSTHSIDEVIDSTSDRFDSLLNNLSKNKDEYYEATEKLPIRGRLCKLTKKQSTHSSLKF